MIATLKARGAGKTTVALARCAKRAEGLGRICSDLQKQLAQARETITRLNRRAQVAEAAVNENLEVCQRAGVSFGRVLANAGYHCVRRERDRLLAALEPFAKAKVEVVKLGVEDVVFIGLEGECSVVVKHFEKARKAVKEIMD